MGSNIRIGIAEDYQLVLDGLTKILETECDIVGTASNGRDAVALALQQQPEIMLLDFTLSGLNGLEAARQIKQLHPEIRVIFVTSHAHLAYAREAFDAGASGYVLKQAPSAELLEAIHAVSSGIYFLASVLAQKLQVSKTISDPATLRISSSLTTRQRQVLQLIAEGKSRKEIADALHVSMKTVEFHKNQLKKTLNVKTTAALIRYALDAGFLNK